MGMIFYDIVYEDGFKKKYWFSSRSFYKNFSDADFCQFCDQYNAGKIDSKALTIFVCRLMEANFLPQKLPARPVKALIGW